MLLTKRAHTQDTISIDIHTAEAILLKENLQILASHYDLDIAEAQIVQAKAWNNPYFNWNQDMYSVELNEYFNYRNQFLVQIDQVFSIAGKHTQTVRLAKVNAEMNRLMIQDVIRSLRMEMNEQYHTLANLQQRQIIFQQVLQHFDEVIRAAEIQLQAGTLASNELVRLRAERISLQTEALNNTNEIFRTMGTLRILLNLRPEIYIRVREHSPSMLTYPLDTLLALSAENRPDYLLSLKNIRYQETNLRLQRARAFPDLTFGYQPKDKGSNYVRPYSGLELGFEMPLFNRNNGNIQAAKVEILKAETMKDHAYNSLLNEVTTAYHEMRETQRQLQNFTNDFLLQMEDMNTKARESYTKRNISLLEYIDLQRIYTQNKLQLIDLTQQYLLSVDQLNFATGITIIQ
jgi:cobalt-zinc-cadmium efflux system outer membrane protein